MGTVWMGSRLGAAITPPLVLFLFQVIGWRRSFQALGVLGLVLAGLWFFWYQDDPSKNKSVNSAELLLIQDGGGRERPAIASGSIPWMAFVKNTNLWSLDLMYFTLGFSYYLYISWFPTYLLRARGISMSQLPLYSSLPLWFSVVGTVAGGALTDSLVKRWGLVWGRRAVGMAGCAGSALFLIAGLQATDARSGVLLISFAAAASDFTLATSWSTCADIGGSVVGTISGTMNMIGNIGSVLSPVMMGFLVQRTGSWNLTFYVAAGLNVVAILLWLRIDASSNLVLCPVDHLSGAASRRV